MKIDPSLKNRIWTPELFTISGIGLIILTMGIWYALSEHPLYGIPPLLLASLVILRTPLLWKIENPPAPKTGIFKISKRGLLLVLCGFVGSAFISWYGPHTANPSARWMMLGWGSSILVCLIGFVPIQASAWAEIRAHFKTYHMEWLTILLLSGMGLVIRTVGLGSFPDMMAEDEGYFSYQAANLTHIDHWMFNPFRYDVHGHPLLFHMMQAVSIDLLGQTVTAARLPSALIGTFTIASTYLMARVLFDRRIATISAIFMMTFPLHVHFSRLALNQVMDALTVSLIIGFLALGLASHRRIFYGLAGITLGVSQYGFSSARLIPIIAAFYLIYWHLRHFKDFRQRWREECWLIFVMGVLFFITFLPMLYFLMSNDAAVSPRLAAVGIWQKDAQWGFYDPANQDKFDFWVGQLTNPFLGFVQMQESGHFYGKFNPFLGWFAPIPFLIGLLMALRHWKQARLLLLVVWFVLSAILGGTLLTNPPEFQRFIMVTPALAVLVGIGIVYIGETVVRLSNKLSPQQALPRAAEYWLLPTLFCLMLSSADLKFYLQDYRQARPYFPNTLTAKLNRVADEVLPDLSGYRVWYLPSLDLNLATSPILKYKNPDLQAAEFFGEPQELVNIIQAYLTVQHEPQAVVISPRYPRFTEFYELLSTLAEAEQWVYPDLKLWPLLVTVFRLDPPDAQ